MTRPDTSSNLHVHCKGQARYEHRIRVEKHNTGMIEQFQACYHNILWPNIEKLQWFCEAACESKPFAMAHPLVVDRANNMVRTVWQGAISRKADKENKGCLSSQEQLVHAFDDPRHLCCRSLSQGLSHVRRSTALLNHNFRILPGMVLATLCVRQAPEADHSI